jgi:hypothetical protein
MKRILCVLLAFMMLGITACGEESASGKAVWQDPNNVVVMWENASGQECNVLRSDKENGEYKLVGSSDCGSFRDDEVKYPNDYFYKIERADGGKIAFSRLHVDRDGHELKGNGIEAAKLGHSAEQGEGILTCRNANGDPVARTDHLVIVQRAPRKAQNAFDMFHLCG